jgi:hypothetical protein
MIGTGTISTAFDVSRLRRRGAAAALLASVPINTVGVIALAAMYAGFAMGERQTALTLGRTNDILGIVGALLLAPAVVEIGALVGPGNRPIRVALAVVGLGAIASIVVLQYLLVTERLAFEEQIGPVMVAFVGLAAWFIASGWFAAHAGLMRHGTRLGVVACTYVGQPWWALRWGLRLLELAERPPVRPLS